MDKIVIYGAGQKGREIYNSLKQCGMDEKIECFCDRNWKEIKSVYGIPVKAYNDLKETKSTFIISIDGGTGAEVEALLKKGKHRYYRNFEDMQDDYFYIARAREFLRTKIKNTVISSNTRVAIFPVNKWSILVRDVLKKEKGIELVVYADDFVEDREVIKCSQITKKLGDDFIVFLCSDNRDRYYEIRTAVLKYVPRNKVIDLFWGFQWNPELVNEISGGYQERIIFNPMVGIWKKNICRPMFRLGNNTGNLIWFEWMKKNVDYDYVSDLTREWNKNFLGRKNVRAIMPASNLIFRNATWIEDLVPVLERTDMSISLCGLGAQARYDETPKDVVAALSSMQRRFFYLISEKCETIGVRGEFSAECLNSMGIKNVDIIGCPSFYRYDGEYPRLAAPNPARVLSSLSSGHTRISNIIERNGCRVIKQNYNDYPTGEIFLDFNKWNEYIRKSQFTFAFGSRFHGNMAALNNGVPTLWITHDWRTLELVQYLNLPYIEYDTLDDGMRISDLIEKCDYTNLYKNYGKLKSDFDEYIKKNM